MNENGHVLVIGAAGLDIKGRPFAALEPATSNPGQVRNSFGGVARNIAENLARLEVETILLTVVGDDNAGEWMLAHTAVAGVDVQHVLQVENSSTGSYIAILNAEGDLEVAVSDYRIVEHLSPDYLQSKAELFASARLIVIDLNLTVPAIESIIALAQAHHVPLCVDPTSPAHAAKICPYLDKIYMIAPNISETKVLCGLEVSTDDIDQGLTVAKHMRSLGIGIAIVTMGEAGVIFATDEGGGHIPARKTTIVDSTGAGDALSAAVIFGLVNDLPIDEAMRLGVAAATLTLHVRDSVYPDLTADMLFENL
jgi:pseudouridine kinase